jgi:hypothetical protein
MPPCLLPAALTVAGQRRTCTGFVVTTRAIRGNGYLYKDSSVVSRIIPILRRKANQPLWESSGPPLLCRTLIHLSSLVAYYTSACRNRVPLVSFCPLQFAFARRLKQ